MVTSLPREQFTTGILLPGQLVASILYSDFVISVHSVRRGVRPR